jgi:hypothetical protein
MEKQRPITAVFLRVAKAGRRPQREPGLRPTKWHG